MKVLGIKKGSFVDKTTGGQVTYCHLHVVDEDKNIKFNRKLPESSPDPLGWKKEPLRTKTNDVISMNL